VINGEKEFKKNEQADLLEGEIEGQLLESRGTNATVGQHLKVSSEFLHSGSGYHFGASYVSPNVSTSSAPPHTSPIRKIIEEFQKERFIPNPITEDWLLNLPSEEFVKSSIYILSEKYNFMYHENLFVHNVLFCRNSYTIGNRDNLKSALVRLLIGHDHDLSVESPNLTFPNMLFHFRQLYSTLTGNNPWSFSINTATQCLFFNRDGGSSINLPDYLVLRYQSTHLCSCISSSLFVDYTINVNMPSTTPCHVDVASTIAQDDEFFQDLKFLTMGAGPYMPINWICLIGEGIGLSSFRKYSDWFDNGVRALLFSFLKKYPILLFDFAVHPDFWSSADPSMVFFHGKANFEKPVGQHAMVIIGGRIGDDGHTNYLVQKFWKYRTFVELSDEYLDSCGASALILKDDVVLTALKPNIPVNHFFVAETCDGAAKVLPMVAEESDD
jgi:hypothetical protein